MWKCYHWTYWFSVFVNSLLIKDDVEISPYGGKCCRRVNFMRRRDATWHTFPSRCFFLLRLSLSRYHLNCWFIRILSYCRFHFGEIIRNKMSTVITSRKEAWYVGKGEMWFVALVSVKIKWTTGKYSWQFIKISEGKKERNVYSCERQNNRKFPRRHLLIYLPPFYVRVPRMKSLEKWPKKLNDAAKTLETHLKKLYQIKLKRNFRSNLKRMKMSFACWLLFAHNEGIAVAKLNSTLPSLCSFE